MAAEAPMLLLAAEIWARDKTPFDRIHDNSRPVRLKRPLGNSAEKPTPKKIAVQVSQENLSSKSFPVSALLNTTEERDSGESCNRLLDNATSSQAIPPTRKDLVASETRWPDAVRRTLPGKPMYQCGYCKVQEKRSTPKHTCRNCTPDTRVALCAPYMIPKKSD